jgi:hypothetical protein
MHAKIAALALAAIALPAAALADPPFQVPHQLPQPGPGGSHQLPTPHPRPLPVSYSLSCTLGTSVLARGDVWHVHNDGSNAVPVGARISVRYGYVLADSYVLDRAIGPGDGMDFVSAHLRSYGAATAHDACEAQARSG